MGSDVTPERLRFDFSYSKGLTEKEIEKVEDWVNEKIGQGLEVRKEEMFYEKAIELGALAFFKQRYPKMVNVYTIQDEQRDVISKEICAGPHAKLTSELGNFRIIKEESAGAGVRRIKAILE